MSKEVEAKQSEQRDFPFPRFTYFLKDNGEESMTIRGDSVDELLDIREMLREKFGENGESAEKLEPHVNKTPYMHEEDTCQKCSGVMVIRTGLNRKTQQSFPFFRLFQLSRV